MGDESFAVHQYLPIAFMVGAPEKTLVTVARSNRGGGLVSVSLALDAFHWFDHITPEQAVALGRALLEAAADAEKALPVTESLGHLQLMVRRSMGGLFDVAKEVAP